MVRIRPPGTANRLSRAQFECQTLLRAKQYKSCEVLASFSLSKIEAEASKQQQHASSQEWSEKLDILRASLEEILGDCAEGQGRYQRAIECFRRAAVRRHMEATSSNGSTPARCNEGSSNKASKKQSKVHVADGSEDVEMTLIDVTDSFEDGDGQRGENVQPISEHRHRYNTRQRKKKQEGIMEDNQNTNSMDRQHQKSDPKIKKQQVKKVRKQPNKQSEDHVKAIDVSIDFAPLSIAEANLYVKESRCHVKLGNFLEATSSLEKIGSEFRLFETYMEMGKLYTLVGRRTNAARAYVEALRKMPYCIEALEALATIGCKESDVMEAVEQGVRTRSGAYQYVLPDSDSNAGNQLALLVPVRELVKAYFSARRYDQASALRYFQLICAEFPNNPYVLLNIANTQCKLGDFSAAETTFQAVRRLDMHAVDYMDRYAFILHKRMDKNKLNSLSNDLLKTSDQRPETWVCLAFLSDLYGSKEKSLMYIDKALSIDSRHSFAHRIKGIFHISENRPEYAVMSFFRANEISKDLESYEGLVEAYLAAEKYKEAVVTAKNVISAAPNNARALTLLGITLSRSSSREAQKRAKRALTKALALDPTDLRPLLALVNLHLKDEECDSCVELLSRGMESLRTNDQDLPLLHTKLGNVYTMKEDYENALKHYHSAISLNPHDSDAHQGLEDLEKLMRSINGDTSEIAEGENSPDF